MIDNNQTLPDKTFFHIFGKLFFYLYILLFIFLCSYPYIFEFSSVNYIWAEMLLFILIIITLIIVSLYVLINFSLLDRTEEQRIKRRKNHGPVKIFGMALLFGIISVSLIEAISLLIFPAEQEWGKLASVYLGSIMAMLTYPIAVSEGGYFLFKKEALEISFRAMIGYSFIGGIIGVICSYFLLELELWQVAIFVYLILSPICLSLYINTVKKNAKSKVDG